MSTNPPRNGRHRHRAHLTDDPTWYKDAIIYELRARSFYDSNGDGIGDFAGLTEKLDYLADLGVTAIWLLPFYPSPGKDDGYDIADYTEVHPDLGTLADFEKLLDEAHRRGIRVITELVLNHTSDQHPWFQRARRAPPGSPERDFYVWSDTPTRYNEARIIFKDFEPSNWTWDREANAYFWHRFYSHQPDLNFRNPAVQEALLQVVDFWLEKGVDGLRLDAVPYLYEEEGTNCENLPETHAFLRRLRTHVDAKFKNRMLLAEANQWPEDAAAYFGNGDECHMNFHFPMMPRMFMAVHMEDRLPIIDILAQTPEVHPNAQWALFLRNHDELTLEMVTDEERDYMYRAYAQEQAMRINLGIRRRLAPLVGNSRRKMELLNGLLFSLPGTPVLYYGDELGMGDNVFLGDRNGVRTPMQWSPDRNAGFSRANPQRLILPIIIDPEYHYEAINVENQQETASSMLWWTKRLIALRKRFRAFGRGTTQFLNPSNSRVLVFIRRFDDETVLVVANLSRFVQYAELDLRDYKGMVPIEMFGKTKFPVIGDAPYMVTLSPHNFYWFSLHRPGTSTDRLSASSLLPPIEVASEKAVFEAERDVVADAVVAYGDMRGWFGPSEQLRGVEIADVFQLDGETGPLAIMTLRANMTDGPPQTFAIALAVVREDAHPVPESVVATLRIGEETRFLVHAPQHDDAARALYTATKTPARVVNGKAQLLLSRFVAAAPGALQGAPADVRRVGSEGHHVTLRFGEEAVMKIFHRVEEGVSTELELGRVLNAKEGNVAPVLRGAVELRHGRSEPQTIALVHEFVPSAGTAWQLAVDEVSRFFDRVLTRPADEPVPEPPTGSPLQLVGSEPPAAVAAQIGAFRGTIGSLGPVIAQMHKIFAANGADPAFTPEPYSTLDRRSKYQSLRNVAGKVFRELRERAPTMSDRARRQVESVLAYETNLFRRFEPLLHTKMAALRIRVHGNLHLGNVLYTGPSFVVLAAGGGEERSIAERRRKRSPLRDVAGMVRSIEYAALKVLLDPTRVRDSDYERAMRWAFTWSAWASAAFLESYFANLVPSPIVTPDLTETTILFDAFVFERALAQVQLDLDGKPDAVLVPLLSLERLLAPPKIEFG